MIRWGITPKEAAGRLPKVRKHNYFVEVILHTIHYTIILQFRCYDMGTILYYMDTILYCMGRECRPRLR